LHLQAETASVGDLFFGQWCENPACRTRSATGRR